MGYIMTQTELLVTKRLEGKAAVITGGNSDIGITTGQQLRAGYSGGVFYHC
jgi:hypothetical protein